MKLTTEIYERSPIALQHLMVSGYGWHWQRKRLGGIFDSEVSRLEERERYSASEWQAYTQERLREVLTIAANRVPHYRKAWEDLGLTQERLQTFTVEDLPMLPLLQKSVARDSPLALLVDGKPMKRHSIFHTSGSTGTPISIYSLPEELQRGTAFREARANRWAGVSYGMPRATFSGRMVEPNPQSKGPYHRYNWFERQVYFSAFHLGPNTASQYVDALHRHQTEWITGYSHSTYQLAKLALERELDLPELRASITTSEKVTDGMRATIERAFKTEVFEEYGSVEDAMYVSECEFHRKHVNPDAGVIEVVDDNFEPVPDGTAGEVVITGFIRLSQPFIRYRVGDIAVMDEEPCPCGREMPVIQEIVGRIEDTVYGPDGRRMLRFHGIFVDQPHVREGQIIQEAIDYIRVRVVPKPGFSDSDKADIRAKVQKRLTTAVSVSVETVENIERSAAGKYRAVVSKLSPEEVILTTGKYVRE